MTDEKKIGFRLAVSWKDFKSNTAKAILYLSFMAIGVLYIDLRINYKTQAKEKNRTIEKLEEKVEKLEKTVIGMTVDLDLTRNQLRRSDSAMADMNATLRVFRQLKKIE